MGKEKLVAVYGSLRKGLYNSNIMEDSELIGMYDTLPIYEMYSIGGSYPGLIHGGNTSIKMEVYKVNQKVLDRLDRLEGYEKGKEEHNHYNKLEINTPFGKAYTYIYNRGVERLVRVDSGDWKSFKKKLKEQDRWDSC